ncbi:hypothetical protein ACHAXS_004882 [Conticribra weissflogii]
MVPSSPSQQHSPRIKNVVKFADTGETTHSPLRLLSPSRQQRSLDDPPKVFAGYVVSIPSSAHGVDNADSHSDDEDAASETSEITWMTFHTEQMREKILQERFAASAAAVSTRPVRRERSDSDANYSRMTNVGVLEVDFGHNLSDDDEDSDTSSAANSAKEKPKRTARRPTKDTTTSDVSHEKHLLDHIIELKLQLAQKQAVIDKLSGENRRLQSENDHFQMRSKQNLTPVDENSPHLIQD